MGNSPSAFRQKTFIFFFMPRRGEESQLGLPGHAGCCLLSGTQRRSSVCREAAEMKAMRKLCKEAVWRLKRERSWGSHSQTKAGTVSREIRGIYSPTSAEVILL